MKIKSFKIGVFTLLILLFTGTFPVFASDVPIYRVFNPQNGEHLFTVSPEEVAVLTGSNGWKDEGTAWISPSGDEGGVQAVYRLYNPSLILHLYTTDQNEVNVLSTQQGWQKDFNGEPIFYSGGLVPIYRNYNSRTHDHHLTTDSNEYYSLSNDNGGPCWNEGVALHAKRASTSNVPQTNDPSTISFNNTANWNNLVAQNEQSHYNKLNDSEKEIYNRILNAINNNEPSIDKSGIPMMRDGLMFLFKVLNDHPEIHHVNTAIWFGSNIRFEYLTTDPQEIARQNAEIDEWANAALSTVNPNASQKEIARGLHDFLVQTTEYDFDAENIKNNQTLISVVENHKSVCAGISQAYTYLLNRAGIKAEKILGTLDGVPHTWTLQQLDGSYSYTDATSDVNIIPGDKRLKREFFDIPKSYLFSRGWAFEPDMRMDFPD